MQDNFNNYVINEKWSNFKHYWCFLRIYSFKKIIPITQFIGKSLKPLILSLKENEHLKMEVIHWSILVKHYYRIMLTKHKHRTILLLTLIFSNLRNKLPSGIDNIPNIVLKNIPRILINEYCKLFNNMLNNSYFSHKWKTEKPFFCPKRKRNLIVHRIYSQ